MGCSGSKSSTALVVPKTLTLDQLTVSSQVKTNSQPTRIIENCLIVWLCDQNSSKFEKEHEQLRNLLYGLNIFNNIDACIAFIADIREEKIFLIISGTYRSAERFHCLSQLEKIYLFDSSSLELHEEKHQNLKYDIARDIDSLCQQLQQDIELCEMDLIPITGVPVSSEEISLSSNLTKQEASFLYPQLFKEIMYRPKFESGLKDVFIDFCRTQYSNCNKQMRLIDEFAKNYRPNKALWWLTSQCFISNVLNRAQRTHEVDILYKLGFFIKQVNIQLNHLHEENKSLMKTMSTAYRGKTMAGNEFDTFVKYNCGGLLSFNNFLISTTKKEVAVDFVCRRLATHPDMTGVVFEIHIDYTKSNPRSPFALLKDSDMKNDDICFHMNAVFHIESVEQTNFDTAAVIWFVKLKTINDDDQQLIRYAKFARNDEVYANPLSYLGKILIDMGEYRRAEQFFLGLLQDTSIRNQPRLLARLHNGLGAIYTFNSQYTKALEHYQQMLQTSLAYLQADHCNLSPIYKSIGDSYLNQNNYALAVQNYEKAIELLDSTQQVNSQIITDLHNLVNQAKQSIEGNN